MDARTPWTAPAVRPLVEAADARYGGQYAYDGNGLSYVSTEV